MVLDDVPGYARFEYDVDLVTPIPFEIQKIGDVFCTFEGETGTTDELDYGPDFTVAVYGGVLTFTLSNSYVPPEAFGQLLIYRDVKQEQKLAIPAGKETPTKPLEWLLDRIVWMIQEIQRGLADVLVSVDPDSPTYILPPISNRSGKGLGYDINGEPVAMVLPDRYPASTFVRQAYVDAIDQRSYADTFRLAGQSIDDKFIRSFISQNIRTKNIESLSDFTGHVIEKIHAGFSTNDRYVTGGRVAYLHVQLVGWTEHNIVRLDYDLNIVNTLAVYHLDGTSFLSSPDENLFYYGDNKGNILACDASTLENVAISYGIWQGATTNVVADASFAFYYAFSGEWDSSAAHELHYTADPKNVNAVWTTVTDPQTQIFKFIMLSNGKAGRKKYLAVDSNSLWETDDPSAVWTRPALNLFVHAIWRKGLCYSEFYDGFFSFSIQPGVDLVLEFSETGETWEVVNELILPEDFIQSEITIDGAGLTQTEARSQLKTCPAMQTDDELGTVTIHLGDKEILIQPAYGHSIRQIGPEAEIMQTLYVKALGITIRFDTNEYIKAAVPLIPSSTELPDDVIIVFDDNFDYIIAYDDDPDYLIVNEE